MAAVAMAAMPCPPPSALNRMQWVLVAAGAQPEMAPAFRSHWMESCRPEDSKHLAFKCRVLAEVAATEAAVWRSLVEPSPQLLPLVGAGEPVATLVMSQLASVARSRPGRATHQAQLSAVLVAGAARAAARFLSVQAQCRHPSQSEEMAERAVAAAMSTQPWLETSPPKVNPHQGL